MPTKISFALEYSLGHITHAENLKVALKDRADIEPTYFDIPFDNTPLPAPWSLIPQIKSNWTARASIVAYLAVNSTIRTANAAFFHTQTTSIFSTGIMRRLPSIVSIDATPLQYDSLGDVYNHAQGSSVLEGLKKRLYVKSFGAARHVISWSEWAKQSLVNDYGVSEDKVTVIPPGIDLEKWLFPRKPGKSDSIRYLFVGGDFERKGGPSLIDAFRAVVAKYPAAALDIVTKNTGLTNLPPNVTVHNGLTANSPALMGLYRDADVFAFPTRGDCLPLAVMEAMTAQLPVITTNVGALSEAVINEKSGLVVEMNDTPALANAMMILAADGALRDEMGRSGRDRAQDVFSAKKNYSRLAEMLGSMSG